ncbi:hypothetical protein BHE74_00030123 [Ensete ventricosum]|nr:hypothetical protein GW17_00056454 [Ensete ventricosum]RWW62737.1 hypothetical protein BHE74_00030123 [Ensete ventricosum]RZS15990.1 hypothetical protein BHM03_00047917 [Ensete ventricosum]
MKVEQYVLQVSTIVFWFTDSKKKKVTSHSLACPWHYRLSTPTRLVEFLYYYPAGSTPFLTLSMAIAKCILTYRLSFDKLSFAASSSREILLLELELVWNLELHHHVQLKLQNLIGM